MLSNILAGLEEYNYIINEWIRAYYGQAIFFMAIIVAFVYLFMVCKDLRYKFLLPIALMFIIALNPILYKYIFSRFAYWRLYWMLPSGVFIAGAITVFLKRQTKVWTKWATLIVFVAVIVTQGVPMFEYPVFIPRSNWEKVSQETIDLCDLMMSLEEEPRVIVPIELSTEVRQYAPEIYMVYGRDARGNYIRYMDTEVAAIAHHTNSNPPNYPYVFINAIWYDVNFIVVRVGRDVEQHVLDYCDFTEIYRSAEHIVYYRSGEDVL